MDYCGFPSEGSAWKVEKGQAGPGEYELEQNDISSIEELNHNGQSIWLDCISRGLIRRGELNLAGC
jgi:hypothetical protein